MVITAFFYLFLINLQSSAFNLDAILKASDMQSLKIYKNKNSKNSFIKALCQKQKTHKKPPVACYKLSSKNDFFCLRLQLTDLNLETIQKALKAKLSIPCRKHLKEKEKILLYRKKDFFIPELKKLLDNF